jgi:cytochrome c
MRALRFAVAALAAAAAAPAAAAGRPALAMAGDPAYGEYLAAECVTCHAKAGKAIPAITGRDRAEIIVALYEFKSGARANQTMRTVAASLGDAEIAALADYLAQLPKQMQ